MDRMRAQLDALMGPSRNTGGIKKGLKEDFKDRTVCKSYLAGLCPFDKNVVGGKKGLDVCQRIHSDMMVEQFKMHPDHEKLLEEYQAVQLRDLEYAIKENDSFVVTERTRVRDEARRRKQRLPDEVNRKISNMKKEASANLEKAESLDDDQIRLKEELMNKASELKKECEEYEKVEAKKAADALPVEEVCDVCGTAYTGEEEKAKHLNYRAHIGFVKIRALAEKHRSDRRDREKSARDERDADRKKRLADQARKEEESHKDKKKKK